MACEQEEQDYTTLLAVADQAYDDWLGLEALAGAAEAAATQAASDAQDAELVYDSAATEASDAYDAWQNCLNAVGKVGGLKKPDAPPCSRSLLRLRTTHLRKRLEDALKMCKAVEKRFNS